MLIVNKVNVEGDFKIEWGVMGLIFIRLIVKEKFFFLIIFGFFD